MIFIGMKKRIISKEELTNIYIDKYIRDKNLAKQMVSTWFNRKSDGSMDWEYLKEKALYSAREDEKSDFYCCGFFWP